MGSGDVLDRLSPEIGALGACVIVGLTIANVVQWRMRINRDDAWSAKVQGLNDRLLEQSKTHTEQLIASNETVSLTLKWLEKVEMSNVRS